MTGDDTDQALPPHVLRALVEGAAASTGEEFFHELVKQVSRALGTKGVWVTEWLPESRCLRALAFWYDGSPFGDYEYAIAGTPCETVVETCQLDHDFTSTIIAPMIVEAIRKLTAGTMLAEVGTIIRGK